MKLRKNTNLIGPKMKKTFKMILCFNKCGDKWEAINLTNKLKLIKRKSKLKRRKFMLRLFLINNNNKRKKSKLNLLERITQM